MCVCFYIYMCIYTPYTINEVKHFHKLISTVLPTFLYFSPNHYNIHHIYRTTGSLLQGDWPWVTRQTQYPVLQYWESACTYIITYVGFSSTHRHDICRLYNSLITCLSHWPRFFFHSFAIYFMTNLLRSSNFVLNWPYFI